MPDKKYFKNISDENYNLIVDRINKYENGIWDSEKELINYLHKKVTNLNIIKLPLDKSPLTNNPWLSGFIDASGHFFIRTSLTHKSFKIECKFELCQRQKDHNGKSNLDLLEMIANFLLSFVKTFFFINLNLTIELERSGNLKLKNYLNIFTSKIFKYKPNLSKFNLILYEW